MRSLLLLFLVAGAWAAAPSDRPVLLLLQFEQDHSDASIDAMKREFAAIMKGAGLRFAYKLRSELNDSDTPPEIILVKFKGQCRMKLLPELFDERGPFATTAVTNGEVQPFSEVACDRVRVSIRSSMSSEQMKNGDQVLGRALGRVLAHEVYHILSKSPAHGRRGVAKETLSGVHLTTDNLDFALEDIDKFYSLP